MFTHLRGVASRGQQLRSLAARPSPLSRPTAAAPRAALTVAAKAAVLLSSALLPSPARAANLGGAASTPARGGARAMATAGNGASVPAGQELAVLGGGCFWCLEACYAQLKGVSSVISGYAGGKELNPTYEQVCSKRTGHAEVVAITYDPAVITFRDLLDVFFTIHDPTTPNRQGADVGPQYRSVILYTDDAQKAVAQQAMADVAAQGLYSAPLVTELVPLEKFWPGEDYHQEYFFRNPGQGYCRAVVAPKVAKFRSKYMSKLVKA